jgi:hypothetical protein
MSNLTDSAIRNAMKRVEKHRKHMTLADGEGRGTGRLVLILKPMPTRVTAEWMAQQWRGGRRTKSKIGSYPAVPLAETRDIFKRDFAELILKRSSKATHVQASSETYSKPTFKVSRTRTSVRGWKPNTISTKQPRCSAATASPAI